MSVTQDLRGEGEDTQNGLENGDRRCAFKLHACVLVELVRVFDI